MSQTPACDFFNSHVAYPARYDMPAPFDLVITADQASRTAEFQLRDEHGSRSNSGS